MSPRTKDDQDRLCRKESDDSAIYIDREEHDGQPRSCARQYNGPACIQIGHFVLQEEEENDSDKGKERLLQRGDLIGHGSGRTEMPRTWAFTQRRKMLRLLAGFCISVCVVGRLSLEENDERLTYT